MRDADRPLTAGRAQASAAARRAALRRAKRRAAQAEAACRRLHGRVPGRVMQLRARPAGRGTISLAFRSVGSDGAQPPAAQRYLVKQSTRPIRTTSDFEGAFALCGGGCSFEIVAVSGSLTLTVNELQRGRRYYYAVAARDNVSSLRGPRSRTVTAVAG